MPDIYEPRKRSEVMGRIRGRGTSPELKVASLLDELGYHYVSHASDLPGRPDFALPDHRAVVFVHGCFWHGHSCRKGTTRPKSNAEFWNAKLSRNIERDAENRTALEQQGWQTITVWECELRNPQDLASRLRTEVPRNSNDSPVSKASAEPEG